MRAVDIIRKKREVAELTREEIEFLIHGATRDSIPDYQLAAFLMAVLWRGLTGAELAALTEAMLHSGEVLDLSALRAAKVDKHSTGGVGDKTSLVIAPVVAAAGINAPPGRPRVLVPMISGRGLGHTGGTLDKLESIPGFNVNLSLVEFRKVLERCGCALIGQTPEIAPADKKLYALRDATATVESPYLICASIMSKKLAEGIDALVLDVKTGSGAFMKREEDAAFLAELMVETGEGMGKKVSALITNMDQPLGTHIGNSLEVMEALDILRGQGPMDTRELCLDLAGWMLYGGGIGATPEQGKKRAAALLDSGAGLEKFRQMIALQGGDARVIDDPSLLPRAKHSVDVVASGSGFITGMNCHAMGMASVILGGGRAKKEDSVDPSVGMIMHHKLGHKVSAGEPLCTIHYNSPMRAEEAAALVRRSFQIGEHAPARLAPLIHRVIGSQGNAE